MSDEASELRARLEAGEVGALLDPLVPLVLLSDAGEWWGRASEACARSVIGTLAGAVPAIERLAALEAWRCAVAPDRRPPRGWDQARREVSQRAHWALTLALDLLLVEPGLGLDVVRAQRGLARQLVARLPPDRTPPVALAVAALAVLDRWPADRPGGGAGAG